MKAESSSELHSQETIAPSQIQTVADAFTGADTIRARVHEGWLELIGLAHDDACGITAVVPVEEDAHIEEAFVLDSRSELTPLVDDGNASLLLEEESLILRTDGAAAEFSPLDGSFPHSLLSYTKNERAVLMLDRREDIVAMFDLPSGDAYSVVAEGDVVSVASHQSGEMVDMHSFAADHTTEAMSVYSPPALTESLRSLPDADGYRVYVPDHRPLAIEWVKSCGVFGSVLVAPRKVSR